MEKPAERVVLGLEERWVLTMIKFRKKKSLSLPEALGFYWQMLLCQHSTARYILFVTRGRTGKG